MPAKTNRQKKRPVQQQLGVGSLEGEASGQLALALAPAPALATNTADPEIPAGSTSTNTNQDAEMISDTEDDCLLQPEVAVVNKPGLGLVLGLGLG